MNCPKCNQPIEPGAIFCGNCGQRLDNPNLSSKDSPIAKVLANEVSTPANQDSVLAGAAYASPSAAAVTTNPAETRAIIALIVGTIGIPASLLPIAGLTLGVSGLVLGTIARSRYRHTVSLLAIIFSILAIIASLGFWVYNIEHYQKAQAADTSTSSSSAALMPIVTPCYSVQIDGGLNSYKPTGCSFDSANTSEEYTVNATTNSTLSANNLVQVGQQALKEGAGGINGTASSGHTSLFAGSPAYIGYINGPDQQNGIFGLVLHQGSQSDNVFIVSRFVRGSSEPDFGSLEANWVWQ